MRDAKNGIHHETKRRLVRAGSAQGLRIAQQDFPHQIGGPSMPDDYDRMVMGTEIADLANWFWGFGHFADLNAFLYAEQNGFAPSPGGWIVYGDRLRFAHVPSSGQMAAFPYVSKK